MKKGDKTTWAAIILAIVCLGIAALFYGKIIYQELQYKEGDDVYEQMADMATSDPEPEDTDESGTSEKNLDAEGHAPMIDVDLSVLQAINLDVKAWLYCPDTVIDYPVCQCGDNSYYLRHLIDRTYNVNGCLFIDCKNKADFSDDNTVIYGHHMASGKMFASLIRYADQSYYEAHPVMYLTVGEKQYEVELFAGYVTTMDSSAYTLNCGTRHEFAEWLREVSGKSDFTPHQMTLGTEDRIVTFSTCAYNFQNARYVVHGRIVKE